MFIFLRKYFKITKKTNIECKKVYCNNCKYIDEVYIDDKILDDCRFCLNENNMLHYVEINPIRRTEYSELQKCLILNKNNDCLYFKKKNR